MSRTLSRALSRTEPSLRRLAVTASTSFATGLLAGAVFWALHVRSPAPPWLALTGLLGMVIGEHAAGRLSKNLFRSRPAQSRDGSRHSPVPTGPARGTADGWLP